MAALEQGRENRVGDSFLGLGRGKALAWGMEPVWTRNQPPPPTLESPELGGWASTLPTPRAQPRQHSLKVRRFVRPRCSGASRRGLVCTCGAQVTRIPDAPEPL